MLRIGRSNSFVWLLPPNAGWFFFVYGLWFRFAAFIFGLVASHLLRVCFIQCRHSLQCRHSDEGGVSPRPESWRSKRPSSAVTPTKEESRFDQRHGIVSDPSSAVTPTQEESRFDQSYGIINAPSPAVTPTKEESPLAQRHGVKNASYKV